MAGRKKGLNFNPDAELIDPFDYQILGALPKQGEMFAGAYLDGRTSNQLSKELYDGAVTPSQIGPRMNALVYWGFAVKSKGIGTNGRHIYQRTPAGDDRLTAWLNKGRSSE